jgi:diguanylate cyclase (GGDEF)-like protein
MPISSDVLAQFNHLEKSGALDTLGDLRKENRELERILNDAALLVSYTNVASMLDFIISKMLDHFVPEFLGFLMHPPRGEEIRQYCYRNLTETDDRVPHYYYDFLKNHFTRFPGSVSYDDLIEQYGEESFGGDFSRFAPDIVFPMFGIGGLYGIVVLGRKIVGGEYSEHERKYVDRMIRFLSVSIQNGLHYESSITEPKTGLFTHDYFIRRLDESIAQVKRGHSKPGLLMLDVDHFKRFNDTWGHVTGDRVLVAIADAIKETIREEDCAARFGGEEFSILVSECDERSLMIVADRVRKAVAEIRIPTIDGQKELSVTVSIGARMVEPVAGVAGLVLVGDADKALYQSKTGGRNRCTLFASGLLRRARYRLEGVELVSAGTSAG